MSKVVPIDTEYAINHLPQNEMLPRFKRLISYALDEDEVSDYFEQEKIRNSYPRFRNRHLDEGIFYMEKTEIKWLEDKIDQGLYTLKGRKYEEHEKLSLECIYGKGFLRGYYELGRALETRRSNQEKEEIIINEIFRSYGFSCIGRKDDMVLFLPEGYERKGYRDSLRYRAWVEILEKPKEYLKYDKYSTLQEVSSKFQDTNEVAMGERLPYQIDTPKLISKNELHKGLDNSEIKELNTLIRLLFRRNRIDDFEELLEIIGAIDEDKVPIENYFQTRVHALFRLDNHQNIFNEEAKVVMLIPFLRLRYRAKIKDNYHLSKYEESIERRVKRALNEFFT